MSYKAGSANHRFLRSSLREAVCAALLVTVLTTGCASFSPTYRDKMVALDVATVVDIESTYAVLRRCLQCAEANPLMRNPISRGRVMAYGVQFGINALAMMLAERADENPHSTSFWHYLPYSLIASHSVAATLNLRLMTQLRKPSAQESVASPLGTIPGWNPPSVTPENRQRVP